MRTGAKYVLVKTQTFDDSLSLVTVEIVVPPVDLPNVTLTTNIFTMEVWMYTGNSWPLYKDLLERVEDLIGGVLMNKQCSLVSTCLRRTLWETMIEVDRYYGQKIMQKMYEHGHGPIPWPIRVAAVSMIL